MQKSEFQSTDCIGIVGFPNSVSSARELDEVYPPYSSRSECLCTDSAIESILASDPRLTLDSMAMHWLFSRSHELARLILRSPAESVELIWIVERDPVLQSQMSTYGCTVVSGAHRTPENLEGWSHVDVETGEHPLHFIRVE